MPITMNEYMFFGYLLVINNLVLQWCCGHYTSRPVYVTHPITLENIWFSCISIVSGLCGNEGLATKYYPMTTTSSGSLTPKNNGDFTLFIIGI